MAIRELGESLLKDVRKQKEKEFKRQKTEAYTLSLVTGGAKMLSNGMKNRANDFLNSEEMLSARAKQNAGYQDAQRYVRQQESIDASGKTAQEYFTEQLLPDVRVRALEQVKEQGLDADDLSIYIREQAEGLAREKAAAHSTGYGQAQLVESPEDFAAFQKMASSRMNSSSTWLTGRVKQLFGGKSRAELEQDTLSTIQNSPMLKRAESVTQARSVYNQTGDIGLAVQAAEAVEDGRIKPGEKISYWKPRGDSRMVEGPLGEQRMVSMYDAVDEQGRIVGDTPVTVMKTNNITFGSAGNTSFSRHLDKLTDGQIAEQSNNLQVVVTSGDEDKQELYAKYLEGVGGDPAVIVERVAGIASMLSADYGIGEENSQKLSSQIFMNRISAGWQEGGMFGGGRFDFADVDNSPAPSSIDMLLAIGELEPTAAAVDMTHEELGSVLRNVVTDMGQLDDSSVNSLLQTLTSDPEKYGILHTPNAEGQTAFNVILEGLGIDPEGNAKEVIDTSIPVSAPGNTALDRLTSEQANAPTAMDRADGFGLSAVRAIEQTGSDIADEVGQMIDFAGSGTTDKQLIIDDVSLPDWTMDQIQANTGSPVSREEISVEVGKLKDNAVFGSATPRQKASIIELAHSVGAENITDSFYQAVESKDPINIRQEAIASGFNGRSIVLERMIRNITGEMSRSAPGK